jgi:hypothetical protein
VGVLVGRIVRVYRWEGPDGVGPYNSSSISDQALLCSLHSHVSEDGLHLGPLSDGIDPCPGWVFGFSSVASARTWFNPVEQELLEAAGFKMKVFLVPEESIRRGEHQVMFDRSKAEPT